MKQLITPIRGVIALIFVLALVLNGCRKEEDLIDSVEPVATNSQQDRHNPQSYNSQVAQSWYALELKLIQQSAGHVPPVAARELGYTGIALYESLLVGGTVNNHSLVGQLNGLSSLPVRENGKQYAAPLVANAALARIIKSLFGNMSPVNGATVDSLELALETQYMDPFSNDEITRSRNFGRSVADAVFAWSMTDGGHEAYLNVFPPYNPPVGADKWVPTTPAFQSAMLPDWGNNRTFVSTNGAGPIDPPAPPVFSTASGSTFYNEAYEVYSTGKNLTPTQQLIANYWADGCGTFSPPGHNMAIALQIIRNQNLDLAQAAEQLAKIGMGLNDAGIVCWRAKFDFDLLRPITYINTYIDANWTPLISTPPFPTYTSGHSTFSAVTGQLLTSKFGNNTSFTDSSKISYGFTPRSFSNFISAAQEAATSRLYGGIHYEFDNTSGFTCGQDIAGNVMALNW